MILLTFLTTLSKAHIQLVHSVDSLEMKQQRLQVLSKGFISFLETITALVVEIIQEDYPLEGPLDMLFRAAIGKVKEEMTISVLDLRSLLQHHSLIITDTDLGLTKVALEAYQTVFELYVQLARKVILCRSVAALDSPPHLLSIQKEVEEWVHGKPPSGSLGTQIPTVQVAPQKARRKQRPLKPSSVVTKSTTPIKTQK